jgi:4-amino-4-deoxy-L-arabinose transferase-like glycosyltransferase
MPAAALFVAVMPTQVAYAHVIRTDMLTTLFIVLAVWQTAMIVDGRRLRHYLLAGATIGVAVATTPQRS